MSGLGLMSKETCEFCGGLKAECDCMVSHPPKHSDANTECPRSWDDSKECTCEADGFVPAAVEGLEQRAERFMDEIAARQKRGGVPTIEEMYDAAELILSLVRALKESSSTQQ